MKAFLKNMQKDPILKKVVSFYHNNPGSIDTAENIASWIGVAEDVVVEKLDYLVKINILNIDKSYATIAYSYTQDKDITGLIEDLLGGQSYD
jgi:response regulator of citrate/malate metabolism